MVVSADLLHSGERIQDSKVGVWAMKKQYIYKVECVSFDGDYWPTKLRHYSPGFFFTSRKAHKCIKENWCDIFEANYYEYAVVTRHEEGAYMCGKELQWYKWNGVFAIKCDKPKALEHVVF